jgi:thiamine-phosphate diphosphorylase
MAPALPRLHLVTNDQLLAHHRFLPTARALLALEGPEGEGVALHLRGPRTSPRELLRLGRAILSEAPSGLLLVNDRVDVARALALAAPGRVGIHLPGRALPPSAVRAPALGPGWRGLLGRSAHLGGAEAGPKPHERRHLHYLFLGTLYATPSHPGRPGAGPEALARWLAEAAPVPPVVAIGGITPERVAPVLEAGAWGVAVLRGAWDGVTAPGGGDPVVAAEARARTFLAALAEARASRKAHAPHPEEGE